MRKFLFQLLDSDGETEGILETDVKEDVITKEWEKYYNEFESDNLGVEEFIEQMQEKYPENHFERVFFDAIIAP